MSCEHTRHMTFSVIIPVKPDVTDIPALSYIADMRYPQDQIEVIVCHGEWPSAQRNQATHKAKGDIIYFCNADSMPEVTIFETICAVLQSNPEIVGVGGPDLLPKDSSYMQRMFHGALSSVFAHWRMHMRYVARGKLRIATEKELVLSNFAIRRDCFVTVGGFNEMLYPNEENELINRMRRMGHMCMYDPAITAYRARRKTMRAFITQFYKYGHGRMRQIMHEGVRDNMCFLLPVLFLCYLIVLACIRQYWWAYIPLELYGFLAFFDAGSFAKKHRDILAIIILPCIYIMMHGAYALGMVGAYSGSRNKKACNVRKAQLDKECTPSQVIA